MRHKISIEKLNWVSKQQREHVESEIMEMDEFDSRFDFPERRIMGNAELTEQEVRLLLDIIHSCYRCRREKEANRVLDRLKRLIPFEVYALGLVYIQGDTLHSVESLQWFQGIPDFEEYYVNNQLYKIDPIAVEGLDQIVRNRIACQFWKDTYQKRFNKQFLEKLEGWGMGQIDGYTHLHKINSLTFVMFSCAGPRLSDQKSPKIVTILDHMIPHIAAIPQHARIGRTCTLTDRQYQIYQLLKTALTYDQIGAGIGITRSSIEKHFTAIKNKTGLRSKSEIPYGTNDLRGIK